MLVFKLPSSQLLAHYLGVFLLAFGTMVAAGATNVHSVPTLWALLVSGAAAGVTSLAHALLGLIPAPAAGMTAFGISLKVKKAGYQILTTIVVIFLSIFGSELVGGAAGLTTMPSVLALILAAIAAGVSGVVGYLVGLVPAPKPSPVPTP